MNCFLTGASGFIGANLVHELALRGHRIKTMVRPGSDLQELEGVNCEIVQGDLLQRPLLERMMRGCDWCFHLAASYHLWLPDYSLMYAANVEGTRNVIEAAAIAGCSRIIHTSTAGCIGLPNRSNGEIAPSNEDTPVDLAQMKGHYKLSKWRSEQVALELAAKGMPVVIVNPTAPVGRRDNKPTPTGQIIVDFLNGRMPAYMDTGLNWVHVHDVAVGHILAAEKGRIGQRYILGHAEGNWTLKQVFDVLEALTGRPAPKRRISYGMALTAAYISEGCSWLTGHPPRVPISGVQMAKHKMFFTPSKAICELGMPQTPPRQALADAVEWFQRNGYVKDGGKKTQE